jgi:hypothetical protein
MRRSAKRSLEELANKSDSDDEDWSQASDRPARRTARKSRSSPHKKSRPAKKRQRRASDIVSDNASLSDDDLSILEESESEEEDLDDPNIPRNARGTARRRTTQSRPLYEEPSDEEDSLGDDEDEDEEPEAVPPDPHKRTIVKLKVRPEILQEAQFSSKRTTRRTRGASEDIYALTNSGRHMETVERGTLSPEAQPGRGSRRSSRASKPPVIAEESIETSAEVQGSLEILESDVPQSGAEGDTTMANDADQADVDMTHDSGVVPESENGDAKIEEDEDDDEDEGPIIRRRSRPTRNDHEAEEEPETEEQQEAEVSDGLRRSGRKKPSRSSQQKNDESDFEPEEGEEEEDDDDLDSVHSSGSPRKGSRARDDEESVVGRRPGLRKRPDRSRGTSYVAEELADELKDLKDGKKTRRQAVQEIVYEKPKRNRKDVDYRIIRPDLLLNLDENDNDAVAESPSRRGRGGGGGGWQRNLLPTFGPFGGAGQSSILGPPGAAATTGGVDSDSSDDEGQAKSTGLAPGGILAPQVHSGDAHGLSGTPANFGKVKDKQTLADADPLGVDMSVNFDSVGGLQGHIDQLKEMVSLPLLYPEIFQRFHITPPRGVLFHGPPGTGKTLLARALANSVSSEGRKVTFYMRKGADALSKWVGEAERQLRLLFEEARKTQPSIIFFDEIDGKKNPLFIPSLFY